MKTSLTSNSSPRRRRYVPPQNPPIESELQRLCGKLAQRVPSLGTILTEVKTIADWNEHEEEIAQGIAQSIRDDLDLLQQERQSFWLGGTNFADKVKTALQTDQPYWVMIWNYAAANYNYLIVMATSREAATEAALQAANNYVPEMERTLCAVNVATRDELRSLIRQMDAVEAAVDRCPPLRRNAPAVVGELQLRDELPLAASKGNGSAISERLAKLPKGE